MAEPVHNVVEDQPLACANQQAVQRDGWQSGTKAQEVVEWMAVVKIRSPNNLGHSCYGIIHKM